MAIRRNDLSAVVRQSRFSSFQVFQPVAELLSAGLLTSLNPKEKKELAEIRAKLEYVKSQTALERSKGTLLEARGLSLGE